MSTSTATAFAEASPMATEDLLTELKGQVLQVGEFIRNERKGFNHAKSEIKGKNDLVSYVDRTAEARLVKKCRSLIPGSGFILEEGENVHTDSPFRWIIDPLDGTTNFVFGIPVYSISLALQFEGETVIGLVYEVNNDELFCAVKGCGASLNGKPMYVRDNQELGQALVATGFPFRKFGHVEAYLKLLEHFMRHTRGIRRLGSAAVDLAYVAAGRFDGYFESNLSPWDVAAGELLVREAGGSVTDYKGGEDYIFGKSICASNGKLHAEFLDLIQLFNKYNGKYVSDR